LSLANLHWKGSGSSGNRVNSPRRQNGANRSRHSTPTASCSRAWYAWSSKHASSRPARSTWCSHPRIGS